MVLLQHLARLDIVDQHFKNQDSLQVFNLSSAECFNPEEITDINLFKDWSAFNDDGSDGYCFDNHGL